MCETAEWLKERVNSPKHFSGRILADASRASGLEPEILAKGAAGVLVAVLAFSDQAHFFANALLVAVPFLLIFVFPAEKPSDDSLLIYFTLFGATTVLDRSLEKIPCYYVLKLALFVLLYIPPYVLHQKIAELLKDLVQKENKEQVKSTVTQTAQSPSVSTANSSAPTPAPEDPVPTPKRSNPSKSCTDIVGGSLRHKLGKNPMESSSQFNLKSESDGFNSKLVGPENNLNDMIFHPAGKLVFNAPFDYDNLTYHMKMTNNSHHRIAYAVKGNAVPRVMANPAFGILESKEQRLLAVTVQKFAWNDTEFTKDRIAFDYVILPDDNKAKEFSFSLFQQSDSKRRKNIHIEYNP